MFEGLRGKLAGVKARLGGVISETAVEVPPLSASDEPVDSPVETPVAVPQGGPAPEEPTLSPSPDAEPPSPVLPAEPAPEPEGRPRGGLFRRAKTPSEPEGPVDDQPPASPLPAPADEGTAARKGGVLTKLKVLVTERELILKEDDVREVLDELELVLLENDVAFPVTEEIIDHVRRDLVGRHRRFRESPDEIVVETLRSALLDVLGDGFDLPAFIRDHERPVRILFTGVNGTGKTTTVAKVGSFLKREGFSVVIAAGDTFRAGAIEQIDIHAERLGIRVIQHKQGGDPSAVIYDAVEYAQAHGMDVVLADTAGRFHNKQNLMQQLGKIRRVMKPDLVFYVDEAVAGNDAVTRAEEFDRTVGADGIVLTKADMDSKGGAAISIAHTIGKPLVFLGTGQGYDDLAVVTPEGLVADLIGSAEA